MRRKYRNTKYWKAGIALLFVTWVAVIFSGTLIQRTEGGNLSAPVLMPFASYQAAFNGGNKEIYRTNFMNVVLFYPAGLLGLEALPKDWYKLLKVALITALFFLVSACIEYVQYRFGLGLAEMDDVIHNTLGALLGAMVCSMSIK